MDTTKTKVFKRDWTLLKYRHLFKMSNQIKPAHPCQFTEIMGMKYASTSSAEMPSFGCDCRCDFFLALTWETATVC